MSRKCHHYLALVTTSAPKRYCHDNSYYHADADSYSHADADIADGYAYARAYGHAYPGSERDSYAYSGLLIYADVLLPPLGVINPASCQR